MYDDAGQDVRKGGFLGEHVDGKVMQNEQEAAKTKHFSMFVSGREHLGENHGDRNKMGSHGKEMKSGYE